MCASLLVEAGLVDRGQADGSNCSSSIIGVISDSADLVGELLAEAISGQ